MQVLSVLKRVPEDVKERMVNQYPSVDFRYCYGMEEGEDYLPEAEILITYGEDLNEEKIEKAKNLKWIMIMSAGMDRMPFSIIEEKDILVTNVRGIHAKPMAEYAIGMFLQVAKRAKKLQQQENASYWNRKLDFQELGGHTMVLLGTGAIASETARLAKAFDMKTIGVSRSGKGKDNFDEVYRIEKLNAALSEGDYVAAVLPSTEETRGLLQKEHFQAMPEHAVFLNMGRGDLVPEKTVSSAIEKGDIAHAVLDVMEEEPLPEDHPFWREENITVTPHISGITSGYLPRAFDIFDRNMKAYMNSDSMENVIDPERGY
ncbi:D-2-hydroxyacid dehydrogenase [Salimicrobium flavidum]|uniref:Phosphoglycerate dehydrogenase n=1 Tax=Salimicrobium flavidum TaxID=570947 RepID=A0A1N7JHB3_9BACI|nr:D-2-hydroxyacid dehydrogenase [Salimicrobium flavidum]SIS48641.1 Phosphoglycerate dehydrogenase [Salimicrobium flavidum]